MLSAKESAKTFFWTASGAAVEFTIQMVAARILGAAEYGRANLVLGYATILTVILGLGLPPIVTRETSRSSELSKKIFSYFAVLSLLVDGISTIFVLLFTRWYFKRLGLPIHDVSFVIIFLFAFHMSSLFYSYLVGIRKQSLASFLKYFLASSTKTFVFFVLILVYPKFGHESFLAASISAFLLVSLFSIKHFEKPHKIHGIFKDILQFYAISVIYSTFDNLAKIFQGSFSSAEYVGYLSVGQTLGKAGIMVGLVLTTMAMPEFSYYWHSGDKRSVERIFKQATRWSVYTTLPLIFFLVFNIEDVLRILGKDYKSGTGIILLILLAQFFNNFVGPNGTLLNMSGNQKFEVLNGSLTITIFVIMSLFIGKRFPWGVALSFSVGIIFVNILKMLEVGFIYNIWPYTRKNILFLSFISVFQIVIFKLIGSLEVGSLEKLLISGVASIVMLGITFAASPEREDRKLILNILRHTER